MLACPFQGDKASGHLRSNLVGHLHLWLPQGWTQPSVDAKSGFFSPGTEETVAPDSSMETAFSLGVGYPELPHLSPLSSCVLTQATMLTYIAHNQRGLSKPHFLLCC